MSEDDRIHRLGAVFAAGTLSGEHGLRVGIGDDAAVVREVVGMDTVLTVDTHVEDVHFKRAWLSFHDLGARSFMAAASDVAAMGATPTFALSSVILPSEITDAQVDQLTRGQAWAARELGAMVIGGNLARGPLSITTTVLGRAASPLLRSGARPGDLLLLAGPLGLAAAGLAALMRDLPNTDDLARIWRSPRALVALGRALADGGAHACIDVSDGLALDLHRLCEASNVSAEVRVTALLADTELTAAASRVGVESLELALHGGEDYALLATAPHEIPGFRVIGRVETTSTTGPSVTLVRADGAREPLARRGFQHF
jgi:thiamine-monophosphate kinase